MATRAGCSATGRASGSSPNAEQCELKYPLKGERTVLKDAQDLLVRRLENLDREKVKAIFTASRFQMVDKKQLERLRHGSGANVEDAALNEWTDAFMSRVAEVRARTQLP